MKMLIDSQWVVSSDNEHREIINPSNGQIIDSVPEAIIDDVKMAVEAAQRGKEAMKRLPAHERSAILFHIAQAIEDNKNELSILSLVYHRILNYLLFSRRCR